MGIQQQVGEREAMPPADLSAPHFQPFATATGYVHDDDERIDRLRAARRAEQEMLEGDR